MPEDTKNKAKFFTIDPSEFKESSCKVVETLSGDRLVVFKESTCTHSHLEDFRMFKKFTKLLLILVWIPLLFETSFADLHSFENGHHTYQQNYVSIGVHHHEPIMKGTPTRFDFLCYLTGDNTKDAIDKPLPSGNEDQAISGIQVDCNNDGSYELSVEYHKSTKEWIPTVYPTTQWEMPKDDDMVLGFFECSLDTGGKKHNQPKIRCADATCNPEGDPYCRWGEYSLSEITVIDCGNGACEAGEDAASCPQDCVTTTTTTVSPTTTTIPEFIISSNGSHDHTKFNTYVEGGKCEDRVMSKEYTSATCDGAGTHTHIVTINGQNFISSVSGAQDHRKFYTGTENSGCEDTVMSTDYTYGTCDGSGEHTHTVSIEGVTYILDSSGGHDHTKFYTGTENSDCQEQVMSADYTYGTCDNAGSHIHSLTALEPTTTISSTTTISTTTTSPTTITPPTTQPTTTPTRTTISPSIVATATPSSFSDPTSSGTIHLNVQNWGETTAKDVTTTITVPSGVSVLEASSKSLGDITGGAGGSGQSKGVSWTVSFSSPSSSNIQISITASNARSTTITIPISGRGTTSTITTVSSCDGCLLENSCLPLGTRTVVNDVQSFCSLTKNFERQKADGEECQNSYECMSNSCSDGTCISIKKELEKQRGLLQRIYNWLSRIFSFLRPRQSTPPVDRPPSSPLRRNR